MHRPSLPHSDAGIANEEVAPAADQREVAVAIIEGTGPPTPAHGDDVAAITRPTPDTLAELEDVAIEVGLALDA